MKSCVACCLLFFPLAAGAADPPTVPNTRELIAAAEPSVVSVVVSRTPYPGQSPQDVAQGRLGDYPLQTEQRGRGGRQVTSDESLRLDLSSPTNVVNHTFGSGLVLSSAGYVLTNFHLVDGATKIFVRGAGGKGGYADVHAADARSDLAVLKLLARTPPEWKPASLTDARFVDGPGGEKASVRKGDFVLVLANSAASGATDGSPSASTGILSHVGRRALGRILSDNDRVSQPLYKLGGLLQTDAKIAVGSSGGAVIDHTGRVIGLTSSVAAVAGSEAVGGYAIPLDPHYRRIVAALLAGQEVEYGFLGVSTDRYATPGNGAVLGNVTPGTPADRAGLHPGDAVIAVDGYPVRDMDDLFLHVGSALAGYDAVVTVRRGLQTHNLNVPLVKFRNPQPWTASNRPAPVLGLRVDYTSVLLQDLIQAQDRMITYSALPRGVVIRDVLPNTPAEASLKKDGEDPAKWVITRVDDTAVATPAEFYAAAKGKKQLKLSLVHTAELTRSKDVVLK